MRALSVLSICAGVACALCAVVLTSCLERLDLYLHIGLLDLDTIVRGRLHEVIALPFVWTNGFLRLDLHSFIHLRVAFTMTCLTGTLALALLLHGRFEWAVFGLLAIGTGLAAYAVGYLRLEAGGLPATSAGPWLAWMLMCLLYGAGLGILCGVVGLCRRGPCHAISRASQRRAPPTHGQMGTPARAVAAGYGSLAGSDPRRLGLEVR